jgi:PPP family 3-phenylpropionic acid transporter
MRQPLLSGHTPRLALALACLFSSLGVSLPFMGRWLRETHHLSGVEIAAILSAPQLAYVVVGPLIAAWADGFPDRRTGPRLLAVSAVGLYALFFYAQGFWALLALGFLAQASSQCMTPLVEGAMMRAAARRPGAMSYTLARGVGSFTFIIGNVAGGALIASQGVGVIALWVMGGMCAVALSAWGALLPDKAARDAPAPPFFERLRLGFALFRRPAFAGPVLGAAISQSGHAFYYGFSALLWRAQGLSDLHIGLLWALGVTVEVGLLWTFSYWGAKIAPERLIQVGAAGAVLRWTCMAAAPAAIFLPPLQALHALTFSVSHVGAMRVIQREAPDAISGLGQTLYASLASGTLMGLSMLTAGALYDQIGAPGYLAMAGLAAAGFCLVTFASAAKAKTA